MRRALELARRGEGAVEPNPMVGCAIVRDGQLLAAGYHQRFGGPHAERDALAHLPAGVSAAGATVYVTLEPCCHTGKTPPCTEALVAADPARVVVAMPDPFPKVAGGGIAKLRQAGIAVDVGVCRPEAERLGAPYLKRVRSGMPWVIAKWAMTLDGRIATATGHSQWISSAASRREVHKLRGRCDAILVGGKTLLKDDPRLTARAAGPRIPARIVVSPSARLRPEHRLVQTIDEAPVRLFCKTDADESILGSLREAGVEVVGLEADTPDQWITAVLRHCGEAGMTNVLVEGGGGLLGSLFDADLIDEFHVYIAPKMVGGQAAISPIGGRGRLSVDDSPRFEAPEWSFFENDVRIIARRHRQGTVDAIS